MRNLTLEKSKKKKVRCRLLFILYSADSKLNNILYLNVKHNFLIETNQSKLGILLLFFILLMTCLPFGFNI